MEDKKWAICDDCHQEMQPNGSCIFPYTTIRIDGKEVRKKRIRNGHEHDWGVDPRTCHDCNARVGGVHHYGCDVEECPVCHQQFMCCDCDVVNMYRKVKRNMKGGELHEVK